MGKEINDFYSDLSLIFSQIFFYIVIIYNEVFASIDSMKIIYISGGLLALSVLTFIIKLWIRSKK